MVLHASPPTKSPHLTLSEGPHRGTVLIGPSPGATARILTKPLHYSPASSPLHSPCPHHPGVCMCVCVCVGPGVFGGSSVLAVRKPVGVPGCCPCCLARGRHGNGVGAPVSSLPSLPPTAEAHLARKRAGPPSSTESTQTAGISH